MVPQAHVVKTRGILRFFAAAYDDKTVSFPFKTGISSRGSRSIIRDNRIEDADGAGVRVGGWEVDGVQYGIENTVR